MTLAGRSAVVTGASSGIGEAIARELITAGARVLLVARRADRLETLRRELGEGASVLAVDVTAAGAPEAMLATAAARHDRADILVNNAGVFRAGSIDSFDLDAFPAMVALNYEAPVRASYVFARALKAQGAGHIVNLSSIGANLTAVGSGVYGGLKRALEAFTDALRIELAGTGVRAGIIAPGSTETEIFDHLPGSRGPGASITMLAPEDVARAVRFMLEQPPRANVPHLRVYASEQQH